MSDEIIRIRGGWPNVPDNLKTKTYLSEKGFKPAGEPKAEVWNAYQWVKLFDVNHVIAKRVSSELQIQSLTKARLASKQTYLRANTCTICNEFVGLKNLISQTDKTYLCKWCLYKEELRTMQSVGAACFRSWFEQSFLVLDSETTGLYGSEIVEIAIIERSGSVLFDSLIKPKNSIPAEATDIHGITNEMVEYSPTWIEQWPNLSNILEGRLVLIYNADFDMDVIHNSCKLYGIKPVKFYSGCIMEAYRMYYGFEKWVNLTEASGTWSGHRALNDCQAALKVVTDVWDTLDQPREPIA